MSRKNRTVYIYALMDPDGHIGYIGQSVNPWMRYDQHMCETADTQKGKWIRSLKDRGAKPGLAILQKTDKSDANYVEKWWIILGRSRGWQLSNMGQPTRKNPNFSELFAQQLKDDFDNFKIEHDPVIFISRRHIQRMATTLHVMLGVLIGIFLGWHTYLLEASIGSNQIAAVCYGLVVFLVMSHANFLWATGEFKKNTYKNLTLYGVSILPVLVTALIILVYG